MTIHPRKAFNRTCLRLHVGYTKEAVPNDKKPR